MLRSRIIPVVLILDDYAVKTVQFKQPKYIGEPINIIRIFNDYEADELVIYDINKNKEKCYPVLCNNSKQITSRKDFKKWSMVNHPDKVPPEKKDEAKATWWQRRRTRRGDMRLTQESGYGCPGFGQGK